MKQRRWRRSLRLRITAGALLVVVVAFTVAGLVLLRVVEHKMVDDLDTTLRANAEFVERAMARGTGLPSGDGPTDLVVQFVGPAGELVGSSSGNETVPPLSAPRASTRARIETVEVSRLGRTRVLAERLRANPDVTLVVARSAESVANVRESLVRILLLLGVTGSVLLGVLIWIVVGRALRPVDVMRSTVETITDRDLRRRLDPPGTGDELDRLAGTLNDLLERLDVAVTRERQFVADASHELRTPVTAVRALLETEPADPASVVEVRAEALARLGQLQDLVEDLLVLAKADAGARAPGHGPVDLDELVLVQARQLGRTTNLRIDTSHVSAGQVVGRDTDLGRVVENLATNAARHARSTVAFGVQQQDGFVEFTVSDDGPGIAPADRDRIFERFQTLEHARSRERTGSGLGLSIAAAIVDAHHGSIRADDGPGAGARFVVRLPAATGAVHD